MKAVATDRPSATLSSAERNGAYTCFPTTYTRFKCIQQNMDFMINTYDFLSDAQCIRCLIVRTTQIYIFHTTQI